jgi:hypothetical protein
MPGELALGKILWEYQMHGWDLARDSQGPGKLFADRVEVDAAAPPLDRLLARSGRDPRWQPEASL